MDKGGQQQCLVVVVQIVSTLGPRRQIRGLIGRHCEQQAKASPRTHKRSDTWASDGRAIATYTPTQKPLDRGIERTGIHWLLLQGSDVVVGQGQTKHLEQGLQCHFL